MKIGGRAPFRGELGVPIYHNVATAEAYLHDKFHLDNPAVWPQYTNVTDRQDRQRSDGIGRTVLQAVIQNHAIGHCKPKNVAALLSPITDQFLPA